jgi:nucleoside-diphosphate-sugar epimerase
MRVLVTGAGGFIGSHVAERLLRDGYDVRVLDNFSSGRRGNLVAFADEIELVEGDIQSYERVHTAVRGCDLVVHAAALPSVPRSVQDPLTSNASNVIGTLNVLLAARDSGVRRVVCASSSSVYGANETLPKAEHLPAEPISPYAVGKLASEGYCRSFSEVYGLDTVALRYFNVFGPRQDPLSQYAAVIPIFINALLDGQQPLIYGDGNQSRDFTFIDNVTEGTTLALTAPAVAGKVFNIAYGEGVTVNALFELVRELVGADVKPRFVEARPGEVRHSQADISRAALELGYHPSVSLREGLSLTIDHYRRSRSDSPSPVL